MMERVAFLCFGKLATRDIHIKSKSSIVLVLVTSETEAANIVLEKSQGANDQGHRTANDFSKLYYESMDRKRHLMSKYYMDNAALVWNGNGRTGADEIQKFLASLPITTHILTSQDVQKIPDGAVGNKTAYVIQTAGSVKFQGHSDKRMFYQTFTITNEGDKWKIVSDCFRFQEYVEGS